VQVAVRDLTGLADPHVVESRSGRLVVDLVHARLFRVVDGRLLGELATGPGVASADTLTVTLVDGARFHDGTSVDSGDVVASLKRLATLGDGSPIGRLVGALGVSAQGPRTVVLTLPRGASVDEVRLLLARPEAAILRQGRVGCGPFKVTAGEGDARVLVAWDGYALGRPWLQEVRLTRVSAAREEAALRFGDVEVGFARPERPVAAQAMRAGHASWLIVFHPRYRGQTSFKGFVRQAVLDARLSRYVDGRSTPAENPWPEGLAPVATPGRTAHSATGRPGLIVAHPPDGEELARALRDALSPITLGSARVAPLAGSDPARASDPPWDLALVKLEWASLSKSQAAFELARALAIEGPRPDLVLGRKVGDWASGLLGRHEAVAAAHIEAEAWVTSRLGGVGSKGPSPDLNSGYRTRNP
jgi:MarR-like DNA-binding transcriptional regulator SgrR of sgrS sRNA